MAQSLAGSMASIFPPPPGSSRLGIQTSGAPSAKLDPARRAPQTASLSDGRLQPTVLASPVSLELLTGGHRAVQSPPPARPRLPAVPGRDGGRSGPRCCRIGAVARCCSVPSCSGVGAAPLDSDKGLPEGLPPGRITFAAPLVEFTNQSSNHHLHRAGATEEPTSEEGQYLRVPGCGAGPLSWTAEQSLEPGAEELCCRAVL